jgi:hypothetical protein
MRYGPLPPAADGLHERHRIDHAALALDGDGRIDEIAAERPQARQNPLLIGAGEPAVTDDIGNQDPCDFPGFARGAPLGCHQTSNKSEPAETSRDETRSNG